MTTPGAGFRWASAFRRVWAWMLAEVFRWVGVSRSVEASGSGSAWQTPAPRWLSQWVAGSGSASTSAWCRGRGRCRWRASRGRSWGTAWGRAHAGRRCCGRGCGRPPELPSGDGLGAIAGGGLGAGATLGAGVGAGLGRQELRRADNAQGPARDDHEDRQERKRYGLEASRHRSAAREHTRNKSRSAPRNPVIDAQPARREPHGRAPGLARPTIAAITPSTNEVSPSVGESETARSRVVPRRVRLPDPSCPRHRAPPGRTGAACRSSRHLLELCHGTQSQEPAPQVGLDGGDRAIGHRCDLRQRQLPEKP